MKWRILLGAMMLSASPALAWDIPADNGTMPQATVKEILAGNEYPETSTYKQAVDFIDFTANGQNFTQVVVTLTPEKPCSATARRSWSRAANRAANTAWISSRRSRAGRGRGSGSPSAA
jgi:hypothetical protein